MKGRDVVGMRSENYKAMTMISCKRCHLEAERFPRHALR